MTSSYPFLCTMHVWQSEKTFTFFPTMIDFVGSSVYRQIGQTSDSGEWICFEDLVSIQINPDYTGELKDLFNFEKIIKLES